MAGMFTRMSTLRCSNALILKALRVNIVQINNNNNNKRPLTPKSMPPADDEHEKLKTIVHSFITVILKALR